MATTPKHTHTITPIVWFRAVPELVDGGVGLDESDCISGEGIPTGVGREQFSAFVGKQVPSQSASQQSWEL